MNKLHIKTGDNVVVLSGTYKGKTGKVIQVKNARTKVVIENINKVKCHIKPKNKNEKGKIIEKEMPLHACKVMKICPKCNQPTKYKKSADLKNVICKKCSENI